MTINVFNVKYTLKKEHILVFCLLGVILIAFTFFYERSKGNEEVIDTKDEVVEMADEPDLIKVYITGCVNKPGIYEITEGQLLHGVIEMAGGLTEEADDSSINMVYEIRENMMICILEKDGIKTITDQGPGVALNNSLSEQGQKININTADIRSLTSLPGIGETLASAIITYRNQRGKFESPQDIVNVPGIKGGKYEEIKDLICVY